jgi:hypothetical protein
MVALFGRWAAGVLVFLMMRPAWAEESVQMDKPITMHPIGVIHSPYKAVKGTPIQGILDDKKTQAWVELKEKYVDGLKDLDGFSHAILLYYFHLSSKEQIVGKPYLEAEEHGTLCRVAMHQPPFSLELVDAPVVSRSGSP